MDDEFIGLALGMLLVAVVIWFLRVLSCIASFVALALALVWLCWTLIRQVVPLLCWRIWERIENVRRWWWNKLWDDPLEKAQREAMQEIENTVHYYVDMQKRAADGLRSKKTRQRQSS